MALYGRATDGIDLLAAIKQCKDLLLKTPSTALLYTPDWCGFAQVDLKNGSVELTVSPHEQDRYDREAIFEARIFNAQAELRWLKQWPNKGRAALIAEEDVSGYLAVAAGTFPDAESYDHPFLLWGEGAAAKPNELLPGWSRLATARIGTMDVPYPLDPKRPTVSVPNERIYLIAREYLAVPDDDEHGNVSVVDERLMKLVDEQELSRMGKAGEIELGVLAERVD